MINFSHNKETIKPIQMRIIVYMAIKNLRFKRLRTTLTTLGVVIGIGSIFLLLSFGLGLQNLVQKEIIGADSVKTIDVTSPNSKVLKLNDDNAQRFSGIAHVQEVAKSNSSAGKVSLDSATSDAVIYGVDQDYLNLSDLKLVAGRTLNTEQSRELLINNSLLQAIGIKDPKQALGKKVGLTLKLSSGEYKATGDFNIVGVIDSGKGSAIFIPENVYQVANVPSYSQIKLVVDDKSNIGQARQQVESLGFVTSSPIDTLEQVNQFFRFFNLILVSFGSIGMLIAILGMLNTLTISLLERTQEIGLMISFGGRPKDMQRLFTAEALILSLLGGIIGIIGAGGIGLIINLGLNQLASSRGVAEKFSLFANPFWLIFAVILFMMAVGVIVSYVPARRASRINPIDALRRE